MDSAHFGDERIPLRHVADQGSNLFSFVRNVQPEDLRSAGRSLMKAEQSVDERSFAGAVGTEQADGCATQIAAQVLQDLPATKRNAEAMQVDYGRLNQSRLSCDRFLRNRSG